jgi:beta-alanine--pyruvate transaminase
MPDQTVGNRDPLGAHWMPFTANRQFRRDPLLFTGAEGMHYVRDDGSRVLDGMAGLWCVNAGHNQRPIAEAIKAQADRLDFVSSFNMSHPAAFILAQRLADLAPDGLEHVFFTNSGSESIDTALKIARAYHQIRGDGRRTRLVGRMRGYHGMNWGGTSISGIGRHRSDFGPLLGEVSHMRATMNLEHTAFSRGQPDCGAELADDLLTIAQTYDPSTIAAVIVEPVTGSGGVLPPPKGYLERLRSHCSKHGILLIFDEVITGFGRLGTAFAATWCGVTPDLITCAKGLTNGCVPMGSVIASQTVYDAFMAGPESAIELMHGYTYSAHPLACAAALATLDVYRDQGIFENAAAMAPLLEDAAHALRDLPGMVDIRNIGILAAIDLAAKPGAPGTRGTAVGKACLEDGIMLRTSGDTLVLSPPLILTESDITLIFDTIARHIRTH